MPTAEALRATEAAFTEDVCRHPGEDAPRLIFADWLDGHGDEARAEFIRLQTRIAPIEQTCSCAACVRRRGGGQHTNGPCAVDQERDVVDAEGRTRQAFLRRRERELLEPHRRAWLTEAAPPGVRYWQSSVAHGWALPMPMGDGGQGLTGASVEFCRGFVEEVALPATAFVEHAAALFRAAPVRRVTLAGKEPWHPGNGSCYLMRQGGQDTREDPWVLPGPLYDLLDGWDNSLEGRWKRWSARAIALDALSAACLLYGRRAAWPCPECKGRGRNGAVPSLPGWLCPACGSTGHTVQEG